MLLDIRILVVTKKKENIELRNLFRIVFIFNFQKLDNDNRLHNKRLIILLAYLITFFACEALTPRTSLL